VIQLPGPRRGLGFLGAFGDLRVLPGRFGFAAVAFRTPARRIDGRSTAPGLVAA
jgi:hypothetical protein